MQIIGRVAAGMVVGLVVFAAGCSAMLSGGGPARGGRSRRLPAVLGESGGRVAEQVASDVLEAP